MSKKISFNFIDVFCGAGGLSCGLEMNGHKCLLGIDANKHAIETFSANHKYANSYCGDVTKLTTKMLKELIDDQEIHVVVGGPPCQGFSTVGTGNPKDSRNTLFKEFVRIVKITKPLFVVVENVTGLLAKKNEKTLKAIFKEFSKLGYNMDAQVLSAHNYGVPEKRRRTILIGSRINNQILYPKKTHDVIMAKTFRNAVTIGDAFKDLHDKSGKFHNHDIELAQVKSKIDLKRLKRIPEGKGIRYERDEKAYLTPSLKLGVNWKEIRENRFRQTKYQRLDRSKPGPTIMTHRHSYFHPTENRYLTQREGAKIQSFPNDFIFKGPISSQWKQIGNAVPPLLGKAIADALEKMFQSFHSNKEKHQFKKESVQSKIDKIRKRAFLYKDKDSEASSS